MVHMDKALRARPGDGHGLAGQAAIALRAHQLGFVPTAERPTPLDWRPAYAIDRLDPHRSVDAWLLALLRGQ